MGSLRQDLAYAWRTLRRTPAFTARRHRSRLGSASAPPPPSSPSSTACCCGRCRTAIPDGSRTCGWTSASARSRCRRCRPATSATTRQRATSFDMVAAGSGPQLIGATGALTGDGAPPERVDVSPITANFLPLLGVDPIYGRHFTAEEETIGGPRVVILGYGLWQRRYGGDPSIVGRTHQARRPRPDRRRDPAERIPAVAAVGGVPDHRLADLEAAAVRLREPAAAQLHALHRLRRGSSRASPSRRRRPR